jgi:hypothetical protein
MNRWYWLIVDILIKGMPDVGRSSYFHFYVCSDYRCSSQSRNKDIRQLTDKKKKEDQLEPHEPM